MTDDNELAELARQVGSIMVAHGWRVAAVESCTGGWIAKTITAVPGSSRWFECALVTYSNESKQGLAGVPKELIDRYGAVSGQVAKAMASGVLTRSAANTALAVTGIAGPDGGSAQKPVGTVYMAWHLPGQQAYSERFHFQGDRDAVRRQSVATALVELLRLATVLPTDPL